MISKLRYRHVYGDPQKEKYEAIFPATITTESTLIKGNSLHFGFAWKTGGGGALAILPNDKPHKLSGNPKMISGHQAPVSDFDFYPFDDHFVATGSEDTMLRLWRIPEGGLTEDLTEPLVKLTGHGKKVYFK